MGHGCRIQSWHLCFLLVQCASGFFYARGDGAGSFDSQSRIVSSVSYSKTKLEPYGWRYVRVDLPAWFSSVSIALQSDSDYDGGLLKMGTPMVCLRDGSLPLPDASDNAFKVASSFKNGSSAQITSIQNMEQCIPLERNMTIKLTNEQISPGVLYLGLFNRIGSMRTQSKMINRGPTFTYTSVITIEECISSANWGPYCNETLNPLSCSSAYTDPNMKPVDTIVVCGNALGRSCHRENESKMYVIDILEVSEQLSIFAKDIGISEVSSSNKTRNASEITLMCYARYDAMPLSTIYDFSGNISDTPLLIHAPKVGRWFISVIPVRLSDVKNESLKACYSMESQVHQCPEGKAGLNCTFGKYILQTYVHMNSDYVDYYYLPLDETMPSSTTDFSLDSLSRSSSVLETDPSWTYFIMNIPKGAAGKSIQVKLMSDQNIDYEIYSRYGGLASSQSWDYFYSNSTSNSDGATYYKLYNSSQVLVRFYILYAREGTWTFGLKNLTQTTSTSQSTTRMSISLDSCPSRCSNHGRCRSAIDSSGLTLFSYCQCDRNQGGFDCSVVLVTPKGHFWQSFSLIASNSAALLPAFWALYQRSLAEWFLFMASGTSSGLYHACDVGTYCVLDFRVLQFMDFWLSFMAVVSTFVYLTTISESSKRTLLTAVWILTALMASTGATRASNLTLIMIIGVVGLLAGWAIELTTKYRRRDLSLGFSPHTIHRWRNIKGWVWNLFKAFCKRYRWGFLLGGSISFALAVTSWTLESSDSYWIWHSMWHVSIYTSSFFFLCSKKNIDSNEEHPVASYELQRQDSNPRSPQL
uniref:EGF-like domain-containing protein n=1 Tax=Kalanchoe fedtschenkoi TaxID=63787 RepID=A0A7N0V9U2_KALFE